MNKQQFRELLSDRGFQLTEEQWQAITHPLLPQAIFAGPGSGKTTVISLRAAYLHMVEGVLPEQILIFTFTRKSAEELTARLSKLDSTLVQVAAGTFHSLFLKLFYRYDRTSPQILSERESFRMIQTALGKITRKSSDHDIGRMLQSITLMKNRAESPFDIEVRSNIVLRKVWQTYEQIKAASKRWDYDDILIEFYNKLGHDDFYQWIVQQYRAVMVDEFQDTSRIQWLILHKMCGELLPLTVVGDDDQSIYHFRGAEASVIREFLATYPQASEVVLAKNFRSVDTVIEVATKLIEHNSERRPKAFEGMVGSGPKPQLLVFTDERVEAVTVATRISGAKARSTRTYGVLARTHHQLYAVIESLYVAGIRFSVEEKKVVPYLQRDVQNLLKWLQAAVGMATLADLEQVFSQYLISKGVQQKLYDLLFQERVKSTQDWFKQLILYDQGKISKEFLIFLENLAGMTARSAFVTAWNIYRNYFIKSSRRDTEERRKRAIQVVLAGIPKNLSLKPWLEMVKQRVHDLNRLPSRVRVMTFHAAKGLEFDEVYLIGLHDGAVPHPRSLAKESIVSRQNGRAEERRLLYVGCTRAKHRLWFSYSTNHGRETFSPSPFLYELGLLKKPISKRHSERE